MTTRKTFKVRRGDRVRIELPTAQEPSDTTPDEQHPPVIFTDEDEENYVFRKKGIEFYDLGTRKAEDGTYRHVILETIITNSQQTARAFLRDQFMAKILEPDIKSSLALPDESAYLYTDAFFYNDEGEEVRELLAPAGVRPFIVDYPNHDGTSFPPLPPPVAVSNWKNGALAFKRAGEWNLRIEGAYIYNTFDTGHFDFKVTDTSDPAAPGVAFKITSKDRVKVYLTPRLFETSQPLDTGISPPARWALMRTAPVVPHFELFAGPILDSPLIAFGSNAYFDSTRALAHYWSSVSDWMISAGAPTNQHSNAWSNDTWSPATTLTSAPTFTSAALVAVVRRNRDWFYVWRTDVSFTGGSGFGHFFPISAATRLYNPTYEI